MSLRRMSRVTLHAYLPSVCDELSMVKAYEGSPTSRASTKAPCEVCCRERGSPTSGRLIYLGMHWILSFGRCARSQRAVPNRRGARRLVGGPNGGGTPIPPHHAGAETEPSRPGMSASTLSVATAEMSTDQRCASARSRRSLSPASQQAEPRARRTRSAHRRTPGGSPATTR